MTAKDHVVKRDVGGSVARSGRRPGPTRTRADILTAARALFAQRGYTATSVRGIAETAGVNPALVHHYFGTKAQLFVAALQMPFDPPRALTELVAAGPRAELPSRLVRFFVRVWSDPVSGPSLRAWLRYSIGTQEGARAAHDLAENVMLPRVAALLDVSPIAFAAAISHLVGLAVATSVIGIGPLADATEDELVELVAPVIARYLDASA